MTPHRPTPLRTLLDAVMLVALVAVVAMIGVEAGAFQP